MICDSAFAGHAGSSESNHGPTAGLKTPMPPPESAAAIAVCCEAEITVVRTDFQNNQPRGRAESRSRCLFTLMQQDFSYLDSLIRHSPRVSGKLEDRCGAMTASFSVETKQGESVQTAFKSRA